MYEQRNNGDDISKHIEDHLKPFGNSGVIKEKYMRSRTQFKGRVKGLHVYNEIYYAGEKTTHVSPNAGGEIQSCVWMLNFISWGVSL